MIKGKVNSLEETLEVEVDGKIGEILEDLAVLIIEIFGQIDANTKNDKFKLLIALIDLIVENDFYKGRINHGEA